MEKQREIKFRAWFKRQHKMIQPCYAEIFKDGSFGGGENWNTSTECVLMQFTGLRDKNGKEIYEGDLFPAPAGNFYRVAWNNEAAKFSVVIERTSGKMIGIPKIAMQDLCKMEICGNKFENPELLTP